MEARGGHTFGWWLLSLSQLFPCGDVCGRRNPHHQCQQLSPGGQSLSIRNPTAHPRWVVWKRSQAVELFICKLISVSSLKRRIPEKRTHHTTVTPKEKQHFFKHFFLVRSDRQCSLVPNYLLILFVWIWIQIRSMHGNGRIRLSRYNLQVTLLLFLFLLVSFLAAFGLSLKEPGHLSCRVSRLTLQAPVPCVSQCAAMKGDLPPPRRQALPAAGNGLAPEDVSK